MHIICKENCSRAWEREASERIGWTDFTEEAYSGTGTPDSEIYSLAAGDFRELFQHRCFLRMDEWKEALDDEDNEELRDLFEFDQRPMRILAKKLPLSCRHDAKLIG